jgi:hypothetical protein
VFECDLYAHIASAGGNRNAKECRYLRVKLCLPVAPVLPVTQNEKFGTFSFDEQR